MAVNLNESGLPGEDGQVAVLCSLHHITIRQLVARDGRLNWTAMMLATARLNRECPTSIDDDAAWSRWEPVDRLIQIYDQLAPVTPEGEFDTTG